MAIIRVEKFVRAAPEICFDAARDIGLHERTAGGRERAVGGVTSGKIGLGETVTFEARHLGVRQRLTAKIVEFASPSRFVDEMQQGAFKRLRHVHEFQPVEAGTMLVDTLDFQSPLGPIGWAMDTLFLKHYLRRFILSRNLALKKLIEEGSGSGGQT